MELRSGLLLIGLCLILIDVETKYVLIKEVIFTSCYVIACLLFVFVPPQDYFFLFSLVLWGYLWCRAIRDYINSLNKNSLDENKDETEENNE